MGNKTGDATTAVAGLYSINDLGFFASLKSRVWTERFGSIDGLVGRIRRMFCEHDSETLGSVWQSPFKRYSQMPRKLGRDDFEVKNTGTRKTQREYFGQIGRGRLKGQQSGAGLVG